MLDFPFDPSGVPARLAKNSRIEGDCRVWTLSCYTAGYGRIHIRRAPDLKVWWSFGVHRVAMMLASGGDIGDLSVLHRCDNPPCFRAEHLFLGTQKDNVEDMLAKGRSANQNSRKSRCKRGHSLDDEGNLYPSNSGRRICAACARETAREGAVRRRLTCKHGHALNGPSVLTDSAGRRICPICRPHWRSPAVRNVMAVAR